MLNGSSTSGKTTIIKNIIKEKKHYFRISYDSHKWSFSQYQPDKHRLDIQKVMLAVAEAVFKMKYNIISDATLYKKFRKKLITLAKKHKYEILEINLEADYEVLAKRFDERVENAKLNPEKRISNTSKDRFKELHDIFHKEKNPSAITLRTDIKTEKEILENIFKLL